MAFMTDTPRINSCPCCHSDDVEYGKLNKSGSKCHIKCNACGHELTGGALAALAETWNVSKEKHVAYVPGVLNHYGNCFISQRTRNIWEGYDLEKYLSDLTGGTVTIRECNYMEDGCVAEMRRY